MDEVPSFNLHQALCGLTIAFLQWMFFRERIISCNCPDSSFIQHLFLSCVRFFVTEWTVAYQTPLSMGILQARILEWIAMPFSRASSQPRDWTQVSCIEADSLPSEPPGKPMNTGVGSLSLLHGIFPTQESNQSLLNCRWILYRPSHQGIPSWY